MIEITLFIAALFIAPWLIDALVPPPGDTLGSFLTAFIPKVWSPTILAIGFVMARGGLAGLRRELGARLSYRRGSIWWFLLAGVVPILAVASAVVSARAVDAGAPFVASSALLQVIGVQIVTGAVGEELGWRGFLLSRLGSRAGMLPAAWIMGLLWALWHIPAFFDPRLPHQFMPIALVLPFIAFFGVFMGILFDRVGRSILVTISAHLSLNIAMALGGAALSSRLYWAVLATIFGVLAFVMTLRVRAAAHSYASRRAGHRQRQTDGTMDRRPNIPTIIGGGRVLFYTRIDERHAGRQESTDFPYGLAICEGEGGGVFLFTCEDDWMPVFDSWHATVDEAKRQAAFEFDGVESTWEEPPV